MHTAAECSTWHILSTGSHACQPAAWCATPLNHVNTCCMSSACDSHNILRRLSSMRVVYIRWFLDTYDQLLGLGAVASA